MTVDPVSNHKRVIALLGRRDEPTDGVQDYCECLARAMARQDGWALEIVRVPWPQLGWRAALHGNDWKKKGLACVLEAARLAERANLRLLVVGHDDPAALTATIAQAELAGRVRFLPPRPDVEFYYASAVLYAGPSLEDAVSLPPADAMACGIPVIISRAAGVSEIITHVKDGLVLEDRTEAATLTQLIRQLCDEPEFCNRLGSAPSVTARAYTWEQNEQQMRVLFERVMAQKKSRERAGHEEEF